MEKFIVSARKYRPQTFSSVVGQAHITTTLKNSIRNNTLAHAFLFCGPRGVGKTTCARILAKTINCEALQPDGEACNACESCISFNNGSSLNIHELDAASNNSVDDIRELVTQIRFAPQEGKYKIYIIDEVHMLSASAFNAFLKTLEEPPSYAKFILATTEKHKILPTILSRCQIFDFKRIHNADTVVHLEEITAKEDITADKSALQLIAQKSEGCLRDSLSMLDKIVSFTNGKLTYQNTLEHLNLLDEDYYFQFIEALQKQDVTEALLLFDQINRKGFEGNTVLEGFAEFLRNLMVSKDQKAAMLLDVLEGMQSRYANTAQKLSLAYLVGALNVVTEALVHYREMNNKRLHVELCLIKLCYLQQAVELAADINQNKLVKKGKLSGPVVMKTKEVAPIFGKTTVAAEASLHIQPAMSEPVKKDVSSKVPPAAKEVPVGPMQTVGQTVEEPKEKWEPPVLKQTQPNLPPSNGKTSLMDKLRQQQELKETQPEVVVRNPVIEEVLPLWAQFKQYLAGQQKPTAVTSAELVELSVAGHLVVICHPNKMNQKFLESEIQNFTEQLRKYFNNPAICIKMEIKESLNEGEPKTIEPKFLNSMERLKLMASQFPMVLDLKEKLKLDLGT